PVPALQPIKLDFSRSNSCVLPKRSRKQIPSTVQTRYPPQKVQLFGGSPSQTRNTGPGSRLAANSAAAPNVLDHTIWSPLLTIGHDDLSQEGTRSIWNISLIF